MKRKRAFAAMLQRSAALKLALAEDPAPVLAVVGACERAIRGGQQDHVLRQWRLGGRCAASGDRVADPAARGGGAAIAGRPWR